MKTALAFAGGDSSIGILTAPTKNPKSETMTSTLDDAELLKDTRGLGKPPLFDGNDTDVSFFPVLPRAFKVEPGRINVSLTIASVAGKQRIFKLTGLAHEITGVKVAQKKGKTDVLPEAREEGREDLAQVVDDASTKEAVADDTASSNTDITSRVSQTTLSDFSKSFKEPSPTEKEEETDDQTRSMDSHEIQGEDEYWSDLRADAGTLFLPDKIAMEPHSLTHFPSQPWSKETKCSGFEESISWRFDR